MRHIDQRIFFDRCRTPLNRTKFVAGVELSVMVRLIHSLEIESVIEIGVNRGGTARIILENCPSVKAYTGVDIRYDSYRSSRHWQLREHPSDAEVARFVIHDPRFRLYLLDRGSADFKGSGRYEFVFIDGNHDYRWVKHDTALAKRQKPRVIVWHDYGNIGDVTRAVHEEGGATHVKGTSIAYKLYCDEAPKLLAAQPCNACVVNRPIRLANGTTWDGTALRGVGRIATSNGGREKGT